MIFYYWLLFMLPMPEHPLWARAIGPLTVIKYVGVLALGMAIVHLVMKGTMRPFVFNVPALFYLLFFAIATTSYFAHGGPLTWAPTAFANLLAVLVLFVVNAIMLDSLRRLRWVLYLLLASETICSLYVIRQWVAFRNVYSEFRSWGGVAGDANYFAVSAVLWIPMTLFWLVSDRPKKEKMFCLGCLVIILIGLTVSASRGGFLGLVASSLFFVARSRRRARNLVLLCSLVVPIMLLSSQSPLRRFMHSSHSDDESVDSRKEMWQAGVRIFQRHPIFGVGFTDASEAMNEYGFKVSHNTYVDMAADLGLCGGIPFLGMLLSSLFTLEKVAGRAKDKGPPLIYQTARGFQGGIVGYMVSAFFLSTWWQQVFWLEVFLACCLPGLQRQSERAAEAPLAAPLAAAQPPVETNVQRRRMSYRHV